MNDDSRAFDPEQLDELLSAELDGELDAAARDLGLTIDEVSARLRATPGVDSRRSTLAAARDLLAESPEIDELVDARLRAKAIRAAESDNTARLVERKQRRQRIALSAGGIAAAVALVVGLGATIRGSHDQSKSAASPSIQNSKADTASGEQGIGANTSVSSAALGSFDDAHALAQAAVDRQNAVQREFAVAGTPPSTKVPSSPDGSSSNKSSTTIAHPALGSGTLDTTAAPRQNQNAVTTKPSASTVKRAAAKSKTCLAPRNVPVGPKPALRATATLAGKPVVVLVYTDNNEHTVVIEDLNCKLLVLQSMS